jgi:hypothetical protein
MRAEKRGRIKDRRVMMRLLEAAFTNREHALALPCVPGQLTEPAGARLPKRGTVAADARFRARVRGYLGEHGSGTIGSAGSSGCGTVGGAA